MVVVVVVSIADDEGGSSDGEAEVVVVEPTLLGAEVVVELDTCSVFSCSEVEMSAEILVAIDINRTTQRILF